MDYTTAGVANTIFGLLAQSGAGIGVQRVGDDSGILTTPSGQSFTVTVTTGYRKAAKSDDSEAATLPPRTARKG